MDLMHNQVVMTLGGKVLRSTPTGDLWVVLFFCFFVCKSLSLKCSALEIIICEFRQERRDVVRFRLPRAQTV